MVNSNTEISSIICPPHLVPKKVYPNRYGSSHYSTVSSEPYCPMDWTYVRTRIHGKQGSTDKNLNNGSYVDNYTLGKIVPGKPSDHRTDCYQWVCPPGFPSGSTCYRCGK